MRIDLYRETPCQHGYAVEHVQDGFDSRLQPPHDPPNNYCPGGSREEVVIDYEAVADALCRFDNDMGPDVAVEGIPCDVHRQAARLAIDAAVHTEKETG